MGIMYPFLCRLVINLPESALSNSGNSDRINLHIGTSVHICHVETSIVFLFFSMKKKAVSPENKQEISQLKYHVSPLTTALFIIWQLMEESLGVMKNAKYRACQLDMISILFVHLETHIKVVSQCSFYRVETK